ncbi:MAG: ATP synthase F1 subunit gamma [Coriobacteriia bacterium]|nr:ATP synthase F1 subunit gamma [Coriobacteriia bacterium]MCL2537052.1 ATP synthase F1 subunit gamma [Coriobacteriia bacterium]
MSNLKEIKNRIGSTKSMRQVTRTMEMVSTAKIRGAQNRIEGTKPYVEALAKILASVTKATKVVHHPLLETRPDVKRVMIIAIASDRGQAGAFNANVCHAVEKLIAQRKELGQEIELMTCGKKVVDYFRSRGIEPDFIGQGQSGRPTYEDVRVLADQAIDEYSNEAVDEIVLVSNRFISVGTQRVEETVLLPATMEDLEDEVAETDEYKAQMEYIYEPSAESVLEKLLPTFVEILVYRVLLESAAAEHAARRAAMKAATDSADTMIKTLTRTYNRARQAAITTEIAEIVGGAAALEDQ